MTRGLIRLAACASLIVGCGRGEREAEPDTPLTFEQIRDTTGLSKGTAILRTFDPYRMPNGVLRVRGRLDFPDGTVVQLSIYPQDRSAMITRVQFQVMDERYDTPPIIGKTGPLPEGVYHFEMETYFDSAYQPREVLEQTNHGRSLRGPGIGRDPNGVAKFTLALDRRI